MRKIFPCCAFVLVLLIAGCLTGNKSDPPINLTSIIPNLVFPTNNAIGISITSRLKWDSIPIATAYEVQLSTDSLFTALVFEDTSQSAGKTIASLLGYTTYYWRVRANNATDKSGWSVTWKFTTSPQPPTILQQPSNQVIMKGETAKFGIVASGTATFTYRWVKNNTDTVGTSDTLVLSNVQSVFDNSTYKCLVTNTLGLVTRSHLKTGFALR